MIGRRQVGLLLCGLAAGCGPRANGAFERARLQDASVRPVPFAALPVTQVAVPSATFFLLDNRSPVLDLGDGGRSFAACVALPRQDGDLRVTMRSFAIGGKYFYPVATLLDEAMRPFHMTEPRDYGRLAPGFDYPTRGASIVKSFLLAGPMRQRARFLALHTTWKLMNPEPEGQLLAFPKGPDAARRVSTVADRDAALNLDGGAVGDVLLELRSSLL